MISSSSAVPASADAALDEMINERITHMRTVCEKFDAEQYRLSMRAVYRDYTHNTLKKSSPSLIGLKYFYENNKPLSTAVEMKLDGAYMEILRTREQTPVSSGEPVHYAIEDIREQVSHSGLPQLRIADKKTKLNITPGSDAYTRYMDTVASAFYEQVHGADQAKIVKGLTAFYEANPEVSALSVQRNVDSDIGLLRKMHDEQIKLGVGVNKKDWPNLKEIMVGESETRRVISGVLTALSSLKPRRSSIRNGVNNGNGEDIQL